MPSLSLNLKEIANYVPAIDARRAAKPCIIDGANFVFSLDGPKSSFATKFSNWAEFDIVSRKNTKAFWVHDRYFYCTPSGIWSIDPVSKLPILELDLKVTKPYWPWTFADVGNVFYFAQYNIGLWQYNTFTNKWTKITTPADAPVKGICASFGRLICLSADVVFWSSLDNGTDFTPSLVTGAGFQALSILINHAFRVDPVVDGILISTLKGYIKGEFVAANYIFRWYVISQDVRTFSPNLGVVIPDAGLLSLDAQGFHVSNGKLPTVWEPEMGNFLKLTYFDDMDKNKAGCALVSFSDSAQMIFVSIAPNAREGSFTIAYAYSIASGKWGVFNRPHHGFFELFDPRSNSDLPGYMDTAGYMQYLYGDLNREVLPSAPNVLGDFVQRIENEPATRQYDAGDGVKHYVGVTDIMLSEVYPQIFASLPQSGPYDLVEVSLDDTIPAADLDPPIGLETICVYD